MLHIRELRIKRGLSQLELAKQLNVAQNTVSQWENGTREPDAEMLRKLSAFFNVSIDYLLGNVTKPNRVVVEELKELGVEWVAVAKECVSSGLTPEDIQEIVKMIAKKKK